MQWPELAHQTISLSAAPSFLENNPRAVRGDVVVFLTLHDQRRRLDLGKLLPDQAYQLPQTDQARDG